jgi:rifampicin phosphotransferase
MILGPGDPPDRARMGGKAYALATLGNAFPIPAWRVVMADAAESDDDVARAALAALGSGPFAVRSSAVDEDQVGRSFAGQLRTYLNVAAHDIASRIRAVRESAQSESVRAYRRVHRIAGGRDVPAVIVQRMVEADCSGVAFSVDPLDRRRVAVIAARGLGDALVSGEIDGDTYRLTRDGATVSTALRGAAPILDESQRRAVAELALRAEGHFGAPQDVEWAFAGGELFLLQSRPITTLGEATLWDNSNIVESYSGVTAPLTFSFARYVYSQVYQALCRVLGVSRGAIASHKPQFDNLLGYIDRHVYYNLLNWYRILALLPGFDVNRRYMEQMMGVASALPQELVDRLAPRRRRLGGWLRLGWCVAKIVVEAVRLRRTIGKFERRLNAALADAPRAGDLKALADQYRALEASLLDRWDAPLINDFFCMIAFGVSRALLRRWCGNDELHNELMIGQGDVMSAEPIRRIRDMAKLVRDDPALVAALRAGDLVAAEAHPVLRSKLADYLRVFGDRCAEELKLESVTLRDDPTPLLKAIGHCQNRPSRAVVRDPLREALAGHRVRLVVARAVVAWTKARVRDRENLRFARTRVFGKIRSIFLAIGRELNAAGLLAEPRDVFCLEVAEVLGVIEGTATITDPAALVALRRASVEAHAPPSRFWTHGATCLSQHEPARSRTDADPNRRQGLGCCPGIVRGRVRVIVDPRRESLEPGEVLVARHTDPGWIALFSNAAAIVVERGSLLSHSAIVAREMSIPAVVAVPGLLDWLATGDVVEIDGRTGTVARITL